MVIPSTGTVNLWPCTRTACVHMQTTIWCNKAVMRLWLATTQHVSPTWYLRAHTVHKYVGTSTIAFASCDMFQSLPAGNVWWRDTLSHVKGCTYIIAFTETYDLLRKLRTLQTSKYNVVYLTYFETCTRTACVHMQTTILCHKAVMLPWRCDNSTC